MNPDFGFASDFSIFRPEPNEEKAYILLGGMPRDLYKTTGWTSAGQNYFEITGSELNQTYQTTELYSVYSLTGLTWKELATIFGVQVRLVHYWIDGERTFSDGHREILNNLVALCKKQNVSKFKLRRFLKEKLIGNPTNLVRFQKSDPYIIQDLEGEFLTSTSEPVRILEFDRADETLSPAVLMNATEARNSSPPAKKPKLVSPHRAKRK